MLQPDEIAAYVEPLTPEQREGVLSVRKLLIECSQALDEEVNTGKWWGGLLAYKLVELNMEVFALGPRTGGFTTFHMMPYYASPVLQERHGAALKKFLTGKSCIKFKRYADVPEDALRDIISSGVAGMKAFLEARARR